MSALLNKIITHKRTEVAAAKASQPQAELTEQCQGVPTTRSFFKTLQQKISVKTPGIIAEIKKASPSKGVIRPQFNPIEIAESYAQGGATCLSVLTDITFFQGDLNYLQQVRQVSDLPLLQKDFMIDVYQLYQAKLSGADCILLIVAALSDEDLHRLYQQALDLKLDVLVEVHNTAELTRALVLNPPMIGINNRNLNTFETDLNTTLTLLPQVPTDTLVITESGIHDRTAIQTFYNHGVYGFLIGEAFMRAPEPGQCLKTLFFEHSL